MTEVTGGTPPPARDTRQTPETRDSRDEVLNAFNSAYSILEQTPDDRLTPKEQATRDLINLVKKKTLDQNKLFLINRFEDTQGQKHQQRESIPVDDLIDFLTERIESGLLSQDEVKQCQEHRAVLIRNSKPYYRLPHRAEPERLNARVQQEFKRIQTDPRLATGTPRKDWLQASEVITKRRELILPRETPPVSPLSEQPTPAGGGLTQEARDLLVKVEQGGIPAVVTESLLRIARENGIPPADCKGKTPNEIIEMLRARQDVLPESPPGPIPEPQPPTQEPEPAPTPEPEPQPPSVEQIRREFVIINRTVDIRKRAAELAEEQLREEMRRGSAWNPLNWPRKIGLRITEEFHRQRYIERATRAMLDNNNSYLTMDLVKNAAIDATHRLVEEREAGKAKIEQIKTGEEIAGQRVEEVQGALREMMINEIIRPAVEGGITDYAGVQQGLRDFVQAHENDSQVQAIFGRDVTQYGRVAEYFATDLLETAGAIKQDLVAHRYAIDQLKEVVQIKLANTSWAAETQAQFKMVDRAIAWTERHRLTGVLINPATIGAAFSLGTFGIMRAAGVTGTAAQFLVPGAGLLPGALFAAFRRNYDLKVDRAAHQVERAYVRQIPPGARRREALEKFSYQTASVGELLKGGGQELTTGTQRRSLGELLREDLSDGQVTNRSNVIRRIAEIKTRLDFSAREKVDLVTFAGREQVEQGRLGLVKAIVEARQALRNAGMNDAEISQLENNFTGEWSSRFTQNRKQQDKEFDAYRTRQVLKAAAFGGAAGFAGGLLTQEAIAIGQRFAGEQVGQTLIERGLGLLGIRVGETAPRISTPSGIAETLKNLYQQGGSADVGNLQANVGPDHSVSIIDKVTGQPVPDAPKIVLGVDGQMNATGTIPQSLHDELQDAGFQINQGPDITHPGQTITEEESILGPDGEWTRHSTNVDHREWYAYDQPGAQGNELRFYTRQDGGAVILDMRNMGLGYQRGLVPNPIDVQEVIRNHEAGWYFTTSNTPQDGLWVSDGADGVWDGMLRLDPNANPNLHINPTDPNSMKLAEFSKIVVNQEALKIPPGGTATEFYGRQDVFNLGQDGKMGFIEAGRMQARPEGNVLQAFATIRGASPVPEVIEVPKIIPPEITPTFEIIPPPVLELPPQPEIFEAPPIIPIPFALRHPLEPLVPPIVPPLIPEYYPYYPERAFPAGARLADILRIGSLPGQPREQYERGQVTVDREEGRKALEETRRALERADSAYVVLGGAIGDAVLSTAYIEGLRESLAQLNKDVPVTVVINQGHEDLFRELARGNITVVSAPHGYGLQTAKEQIASSQASNPLVINLEHYRAENPRLTIKEEGGKTIATLDNLLAPSIELYNIATDQEQRFAHYMEELFSLPKDSLNQTKVRPRIELPQNKEDIYDKLTTRFGIDKNRPQTAIVVESASADKRYAMNNWATVISQLSSQFPQMQFNIIFNPSSQVAGFTRVDIEKALRNARVLDSSHLVSGSLLELAVLLEKQNLVISNDTGLAHIATALERGPSVISLHIPSFPPQFWVASPKKQTGIVPPQGATDINAIPPEEVVRQALEVLQTTAPIPPPTEPLAAEATAAPRQPGIREEETPLVAPPPVEPVAPTERVEIVTTAATERELYIQDSRKIAEGHLVEAGQFPTLADFLSKGTKFPRKITETVINGERNVIASDLFYSRVLPTDDPTLEMAQNKLSPEDYQEVKQILFAKIQQQIASGAFPQVFFRGRVTTFEEDKEWLEVWQRHFEELAAPVVETPVEAVEKPPAEPEGIVPEVITAPVAPVPAGPAEPTEPTTEPGVATTESVPTPIAEGKIVQVPTGQPPAQAETATPGVTAEPTIEQVPPGLVVPAPAEGAIITIPAAPPSEGVERTAPSQPVAPPEPVTAPFAPATEVPVEQPPPSEPIAPTAEQMEAVAAVPSGGETLGAGREIKEPAKVHPPFSKIPPEEIDRRLKEASEKRPADVLEKITPPIPSPEELVIPLGGPGLRERVVHEPRPAEIEQEETPLVAPLPAEPTTGEQLEAVPPPPVEPTPPAEPVTPTEPLAAEAAAAPAAKPAVTEQPTAEQAGESLETRVPIVKTTEFTAEYREMMERRLEMFRQFGQRSGQQKVSLRDFIAERDRERLARLPEEKQREQIDKIEVPAQQHFIAAFLFGAQVTPNDPLLQEYQAVLADEDYRQIVRFLAQAVAIKGNEELRRQWESVINSWEDYPGWRADTDTFAKEEFTPRQPEGIREEETPLVAPPPVEPVAPVEPAEQIEAVAAVTPPLLPKRLSLADVGKRLAGAGKTVAKRWEEAKAISMSRLKFGHRERKPAAEIDKPIKEAAKKLKLSQQEAIRLVQVLEDSYYMNGDLLKQMQELNPNFDRSDRGLLTSIFSSVAKNWEKLQKAAASKQTSNDIQEITRRLTSIGADNPQRRARQLLSLLSMKESNVLFRGPARARLSAFLQSIKILEYVMPQGDDRK